MPLTSKVVLAELEAMAPLRLAESWDNVGLLVDPHEGEAPCERLLLTVDLTWPVFEEAVRQRSDLIVAYHPVIFRGVQRLRAQAPAERVIVAALRQGVIVYSPHTALDAVSGGMTDWLAVALGEGATRPIVPTAEDPAAGQGRLVELAEPLALDAAVSSIKAHLGLAHLRLASASRHAEGAPIRTLAVCPGAGGSVFEKVGDVDLLLTGELRHHDVLARAARGTSVVLCDHTNTERGFLPIFAERVRQRLPGLEVLVSSADRDPLVVS